MNTHMNAATEADTSTGTGADADSLTAASEVADALVEVRLLVDGPFGPAGAVASIPAAQVASARASGVVDDTPESVAYARRVNRTQQPAAAAATPGAIT